jgi:DNA-binding transcriptional LysR family regulator
MRICHIRAMTEAQLRVLVTVADVGGFSPAAARLSMSQPGVSRAVAALEAELGTALLVRRNGRTAPTAAGKRVLLHAREVLARAEAIRQEAAAERGDSAGRVRLGSFASVSAQLLPGILATLRVRHPGVEVALFEGHDEEVIGWVRERTVDVGVVSRDAPDLDVRPLAADQLVAVLPAAHPLAGHPRATLEQLAAEPFVLSRGGCERLILDTFTASGHAPQVAFEVQEVSTILAMVAEGLGVSLVPSLSAVALPQRVTLRPLAPPVERRLGLAVPSLASAPPAVRALLEVAELASQRLDNQDLGMP